MHTYTVREWDKLTYGDGEGQIPERFADRLAALAERSTFAGRGGTGVLEHGRHALRARGVVGILAAGDCSLEILPKIDVDAGDNINLQNAAIRKRLIHMLAVALNLKIDLGSVTEIAWQRETLLEILIRIFSEKLTEAVRKGMPRRYCEQEDDLPALRGRLNVVRQFTRHAVNPSRLSCQFDVLSEDIMLNRISLQGGRLFCLSADGTNKGLFQTKPDILVRRAGMVTHVIDTKWKRISSRIDDPKQGVSQADVYQMMAYAQLYHAPRLTLLYPHHPGLGSKDDIHARHRITGHETILETASIDVSDGRGVLDRIRQLLFIDAPTEMVAN